MMKCCLPVAQQLRQGAGGHPTPFDEIRAASALLLWGLLATNRLGTCRDLSAAARRFWGPVLHTAAMPLEENEQPFYSGSALTADSSHRDAAKTGSPEAPGAQPNALDGFGHSLFERTWGATDAGTLTCLLEDLPAPLRTDALVAELALDWLLWDEPWLRHRPAARWLARSTTMKNQPRVQRTYESILSSRVGVWHLEDAVPNHGFQLRDRLTGDRTFVNTPSDPWPDANQRLLVARIYPFNEWRLIGGRCLLLDPVAADRLLTTLEQRRVATKAPTSTDPRWRPWLKAALLPAVAGECFRGKLATPPAGRYHGARC
jgi:hypothetical protein